MRNTAEEVAGDPAGEAMQGSTSTFRFGLGQTVEIIASGERGEVIGRAEYSTCESGCLVRYKAGDGRAVESWWTQSALTAVKSGDFGTERSA
jgi:hypothetical protein